MRKLVDKLRHSLVIRVGLIYAVAAWLIVQVVEVIVLTFGLPNTVAKVTAQLAFLDIIVVLWFSWVLEAAAPTDRKCMFMRLAWVWGPALVALHVAILVQRVFFYPGSLTKLLFSASLILFVITIWMQISNPFARAWVFRRANHTDALMEAERRLAWPLSPKEIRATEIHIAPQLYYTFLAAIAALVFIISETLLGELFGDTLGTVGYIGAAVIAIGIATVSYPLHKRVSKYVSLRNDVLAKSGAKNAQSIAIEVRTALINIFKILFVRYWYITIPGLLVMSYFVVWVADNV